mmetsp:Transcript_26831/g.65099  ORF Transcript_26831/g.65099 Transcript_26831/m.65099 type:complete len:338 (+) Transcript_26831:655-1668(+)
MDASFGIPIVHCHKPSVSPKHAVFKALVHGCSRILAKCILPVWLRASQRRRGSITISIRPWLLLVIRLLCILLWKGICRALPRNSIEPEKSCKAFQRALVAVQEKCLRRILLGHTLHILEGVWQGRVEVRPERLNYRVAVLGFRQCAQRVYADRVGVPDFRPLAMGFQRELAERVQPLGCRFVLRVVRRGSHVVQSEPDGSALKPPVVGEVDEERARGLQVRFQPPDPRRLHNADERFVPFRRAFLVAPRELLPHQLPEGLERPPFFSRRPRWPPLQLLFSCLRRGGGRWRRRRRGQRIAHQQDLNLRMARIPSLEGSQRRRGHGCGRLRGILHRAN